MFKVGDEVTTEAYGKGVVAAITNVELPSDGDHTVYVVAFPNGERRHFKTSDLS